MRKRFIEYSIWVKIKPWVILSTYILILAFVLLNIQGITSSLGFFISLFKSLFIAIFIAYIMNLPMRNIENFIIKHTKEKSRLRKSKRVISMILTFLFMLLLLTLIGSIILPSIIDSLIMLMENLSAVIKDILGNVDKIFVYFNIDFKLEEISQINEFMKMPWDQIFTNVIKLLSGSAEGLLNSAGNFISTFMIGFTSFMFSLYLLSGKENFIRQMRKVVTAFVGHEKATGVFGYAGRVNRIFSNFIGGQLTEACIIGALYYVGMRIFGFPYPELLATLIGVCSLVPVFGSMFAMSIGAIMMLTEGFLTSFLFIVFYQVISYFEDNVIYPRVVGNAVGLPGLWVLLSIFVFGDLWGIMGMVIAVPTAACLYVFFSEFVNRRLKKQKVIVTDTEIVTEQTDIDTSSDTEV